MNERVDVPGYVEREYRVEKYCLALRLNRKRIAQRLYVSDAHVADVLRRWMRRALARQEPNAVMGREVVARVRDDYREAQPRLLAYVRAIRDVHPDDRDAAAQYIDTVPSVRVPVMRPLAVESVLNT